jgi:tetratricopeptide (TPR) repeat protein
MIEKKIGREPVVFWPGLLLAVLYGLAGLIPIQSLWGINHLQYFEIPGKIVFLLLLTMSSFSFFVDAIVSVLRKILIPFSGAPRFVQIAIIALLSVALLYFLRVHIHSLGDGYLRAYQLGKGYYFYHTEFLDFLLHALLFRLINTISEIAPETLYSLFSIFCGVFFIIAFFLFKFPLSWKSENIIPIKILLITMGGSQLFFGYVESYSLIYPIIILYILLGIRYLENGQGLIRLSIFMALIPFVHISGLLLLPAHIYLLFGCFGEKNDFPKSKRISPIIIVATGLIGISSMVYFVEWKLAQISGVWNKSLLPLFLSSGYSIISLRHLFDIFNEFLLIFPIPAILLWLIIGHIRGDGDSKRIIYFLIFVVIGALLFMATIDPKLGMARDWDLFANPASAIGAAVVLLFFKFYSEAGRIGKFVAIIAIILNILWILTNSSPAMQLARAENLLKIDEKGQPYVTETIAYYYLNLADNPQKALQLYESIPEKYKNARAYGSIAKIKLDMGQPREALEAARKGLLLDSMAAWLNMSVGAALLGLDSSAQAVPYLIRAQNKMPNDPTVLNMLANVFMNLKRYEQAAVCLDILIENDPNDAQNFIKLGELYYQTGRLDSAYMTANKALHIDPDNKPGWELLQKIKTAAASQNGR